MKLKEYLEHLNKIVKENPKLLDCDVVEEQENKFYSVSRKPEIGKIDYERYSFISTYKNQKPNAVCIN